MTNLLSGSGFNMGEDDVDEEYDYFETLVTRGSARGVLTIHVKSCRDFKTLTVKKETQGFLRFSVGGHVKCTRLQPYKDPKSAEIKMPFNEWKYISIRIPKEGEKTLDPTHGLMTVELIFFELDTGNPKLIGRAFVKLADILNKDKLTINVDLKLSKQMVCKLDLDLVITYGSFGYGYSHQIRNPRRSIDSFVDRSLFLRCPPPEERRDPHYNVITPRPIPFLDIIGSLLKREKLGPEARDTSRIFPPVLMDMLQRRGRLLQLHEKFQDYDSQSDVLLDLEKLIQKRGLPSANSWRQNRKAKKVLSRWRTKASLIPKLLGFIPETKKRGKAQQQAALAAGQTDVPQPQPNATLWPSGRSKSPRPGSTIPKVSFADEQADATAPLFAPGESLLPGVTEIDGKEETRLTEMQEEAVVRGLNDLSLSPQSRLSPPSPPPTTSSRGASPMADPGETALSTGQAGGVQVTPKTSRPLGTSSPWARLAALGATTAPAVVEVSPATSAQGAHHVSAGSSQNQNRPVQPPPVGATSAVNSPAPQDEDLIEMWLRKPSSIPSLGPVLSEQDLEPIRNSLAFDLPAPGSSAHLAECASSVTSGARAPGPKPGRDRLKSLEEASNPYRKHR
ncbi:hypothetical protein ACEWY4_016681 [Coilia grayii]|uniref:Cation channel sperm-associated targeting subunit tau C2 domain-containing protein n=1 Tax=Coilia grayii TaxID=363190 RepID=A0ABD1JL23_9TELE